MAQESKLQKKIIQRLEKHGWVVHKVILSSKPGWPDIEAFRMSDSALERPTRLPRAIFIEVKAKGKTAGPLQKHRHDLLQKEGFSVYVIDSWSQFLKLNL